MADQIRVNGNLHSWGSIIVKIRGERFYGITEITYGDKRERVKGYGMGAHQAPRGRSRGKYTVEPVKFKAFKSTAQAIRSALAAASSDGVSYGNSEFEVIVQTVESDETPLNVEIERCTLVSDASSHSESPDPLQDELEADAMLIRRNGLTLFDSSKGTP